MNLSFCFLEDSCLLPFVPCLRAVRMCARACVCAYGWHHQVQAAGRSVKSAQDHVDTLSSEISKIESSKVKCKHWYSVDCHADNAWRDAKIGGLESAKLAADAALEVAQGVLSAAQAVVKESGKIVPSIDPQVLGWEAENVGIESAGKVAKATLQGVQGLVDGAAEAAEWILTEASDLFNIESASFAAESLVQVQPAETQAGGFQCTCTIKGEVCRHEFAAFPVRFCSRGVHVHLMDHVCTLTLLTFRVSLHICCIVYQGTFGGHSKSWSGSFFFPPAETSVLDDVMRLVKVEVQGARLGGW